EIWPVTTCSYQCGWRIIVARAGDPPSSHTDFPPSRSWASDLPAPPSIASSADRARSPRLKNVAIAVDSRSGSHRGTGRRADGRRCNHDTAGRRARDRAVVWRLGLFGRIRAVPVRLVPVPPSHEGRGEWETENRYPVGVNRSIANSDNLKFINLS